MPRIERLTIWCCDRKWRYLALRKAKVFGIMDVLPEEGVDLMGIESTTDAVSVNPVVAWPTGSTTIVAGEVSTAHQ